MIVFRIELYLPTFTCVRFYFCTDALLGMVLLYIQNLKLIYSNYEVLVSVLNHSFSSRIPYALTRDKKEFRAFGPIDIKWLSCL